MYKNSSHFLQHRAIRAAESGHEKRKRGVPRKLKQALKSSQLVNGKIYKQIKGGYNIYFSGFIASCPRSEMYPHPLSKYDYFRKLYGKTLKFTVVEVKLENVIVSRKKAVQIETWNKIKKAFKIYSEEDIKCVLSSYENIGEEFKNLIYEIFKMFEKLPKNYDRETLLNAVELLTTEKVNKQSQ